MCLYFVLEQVSLYSQHMFEFRLHVWRRALHAIESAKANVGFSASLQQKQQLHFCHTNRRNKHVPTCALAHPLPIVSWRFVRSHGKSLTHSALPCSFMQRQRHFRGMKELLFSTSWTTVMVRRKSTKRNACEQRVVDI